MQLPTIPILLACSMANLHAQNPQPASAAPAAKVPMAPQPGDQEKRTPPTFAKRDAAAATEVGRPGRDLATRQDGLTAGRFTMPAEVALDRAADGRIWARGADWKASFDDRSCTFVPFLGSDAPANQPLTLRLQSIHLAGEPLEFRPAAPSTAEDRIERDFGPCVERFDLAERGVEQSWVFRTLPQRGELRLQLATDTPLHGIDRGANLWFGGPRGGVAYEHAVAIDANGRRLPLELDLRDGLVELVVPADFVAAATLPLVVDPFLSTVGLGYSGNFSGNPDVAFDYTTQEFLAVWQFAYSATDHDVWAQRLDLGQNAIGTPFTLDFTSTSWTKPRVANNGLADNFLVVAECSQGFVSPYWIGGRLWSAAAGAGPQFDVERAGQPGSYTGDARNPDVGGDPLEVGPTFYTVVWEREYSSTDHDILARQVTDTGVLRGGAPMAIDVSTRFQARPRISKSNGYSFANNWSSQRWAVVYEDHYSATDVDVRGTQLTWDGQLPPSGPNHPISLSSTDERSPVVGSPTDEQGGARIHTVAWQRVLGPTDSDILVAAWDGNLVVQGLANLQALENAGGAGLWPQFAASIDGDGVRAVVAYSEAWQGGSDIDVRASVVAFDAGTGTFTAHEARTAIRATTHYEGTPAVASTWSGGGSTVDYCLVLQERDPFGTHGILAAVFAGHSNQHALPALRSTGCGTLGISWTDVPALGRTLALAQTDQGPLTGFVVGAPTTIPVPGCPGCTLGVQGVTVPNPFTILMPLSPAFVGLPLAAQAWSFGSGPCLGAIGLSDTVDFTIL